MIKLTEEQLAHYRAMADKSWQDQLTHAYAEGRKDERAEVSWAEDCARVLLKLKDSLAERGARPTTPKKAAMWDEAWAVYTRMLAWANTIEETQRSFGPWPDEHPAAPQCPLTEMQIAKMRDDGVFMRPIVQIIRAIEAAHGIKSR